MCAVDDSKAVQGTIPTPSSLHRVWSRWCLCNSVCCLGSRHLPAGSNQTFHLWRTCSKYATNSSSVKLRTHTCIIECSSTDSKLTLTSSVLSLLLICILPSPYSFKHSQSLAFGTCGAPALSLWLILHWSKLSFCTRRLRHGRSCCRKWAWLQFMRCLCGGRWVTPCSTGRCSSWWTCPTCGQPQVTQCPVCPCSCLWQISSRKRFLDSKLSHKETLHNNSAL